MKTTAAAPRRPLAALLLLAVIWGYNWVVMKSALQFAGAAQLGALRTLGGALTLFAVLVLTRRPLRPCEVPATLLLGLLQTTGFTGLIVLALVQGGAGKTAVLTYTMPFWVLLFAWPLLGERIRGAQWAAVGLSLAGLLCILEPWHLHGNMPSMVLALLAGVSWAFSVILAKKLHQRAPDMDLLSFTAWQMLFGSLPIVAAALLIPAPPVQWTGYFLAAVIYNILLANALAWLLWLFALRRLAAGVASMASLLVPVIGVLAAWLELGERPTPQELLGMTLIVAALATLSAVGMRRHLAIDSAMAQE